MKNKAFFVRGTLIFAVSVLFQAVLAAASAPGTRPLVDFSLSTNGGNPTPIPFTLELRSAELSSFGMLTGSDLVEDPLGNTAIGYQAFYSNVTGQYNLACGFSALHFSSSGSGNTATGAFALERNVDGWENTACGAFSLNSNTSGWGNTANGHGALMSNTSGTRNTAAGRDALWANTTGEYNTANGFAALYFNTGSYNTANGHEALYSNTAGEYNTATGCWALYNNTGKYNTAIGAQAGQGCTDGSWNIYLGAFVSSATAETNTIRIGIPYNFASTNPSGQNRTFITGIIENPMDTGSSPSVVGVAPDGRLGTYPTELLPPKGDTGPQGPQGIQGLPGEGLISGSLLFLNSGFAPPAKGYAFLGSMDLALTVPGVRKPVKVTVNVYQKQ